MEGAQMCCGRSRGAAVNGGLGGRIKCPDVLAERLSRFGSGVGSKWQTWGDSGDCIGRRLRRNYFSVTSRRSSDRKTVGFGGLLPTGCHPHQLDCVTCGFPPVKSDEFNSRTNALIPRCLLLTSWELFIVLKQSVENEVIDRQS